MTQGEFIERLLDVDRIVSEQDIRDFVAEQSNKIPSLLALIKRECGWLFSIKESKFVEVETYRNEQRRRVAILIDCIKQQTGSSPRMLPDFLTERGMNAFKKTIELRLIDKVSFAWMPMKPNLTALSKWVHDICKVGGCSTPMKYNRETDWASFEKYFGVKGLARKYNKSEYNLSCPDYDKVRERIFPELEKS